MEKIPSGKSGKRVYITKDSIETRSLGARIAKELTNGAILCLYGELGGGKTTFVQGLAKGLGVEQRIISPTFIIVRNYGKNFYHIDLYRTENIRDIKGLGLEEIFNDPSNIIVIEWAERMGELLPRDRVDIKFEYMSEEKRRITILES